MRRWLRSARLALFGAMALSSCAGSRGPGWVVPQPPPAAAGETFSIIGTVHHLDLEGGVFVIRDASGTQYQPMNLPESFRRDGMLVEAQVQRRDDMASISMVGPLVEVLRIRVRTADADSTASLVGSSWRLEDLGGRGVVDIAQATLAFPEAGAVAGSASCNRFHGTATIHGDSITFGPLAATRKACPEAIMNQENLYLDALAGATRYEVDEPYLYLYTSAQEAPLRFVREK